MIFVIASRYDNAALQLPRSWSREHFVVSTPADLSCSGWRYCMTSPETSTAVVSGRVVSCSEITGVLTRLVCIHEWDLPHIIPEDRGYVAAEMNAFLLFWLSTIRCPVLNRPSAGNLCGPNWSSEQWVQAANKLGIASLPARRCIPPPLNAEEEKLENHTIKVVVVGSQVFGCPDEILKKAAKKLAVAADVGLLGINFSVHKNEYYFLGANSYPDLSIDGVAEAVEMYLSGAI
jgi:hypothetical protein